MFDFSQKRFLLAPLAGWTDLPFRSTVKKFGADLTVSEMISANALACNPKKTLKLAEKSERENPYSVQIAGSKEEMIRRAVEVLNDQPGIDIIDLNSGCPAPKIVKNGNGSALLKDLDLLKRMISLIKETSNKPQTSVKVRIGFNETYGVEIARACEEAGADFMVVHGRTRAGMYKMEVDYDEIRKMKEAVSIPVVANGDIDSYEKAIRVMEETGADGVMIGRGAIGKPWIFTQLKEGRADVTPEMIHQVVMEHYDNMLRFHGEYGVMMFRKHLHNYSKGYPEASSFRSEINHINDPETMRQRIDHFFSQKGA